MPLFWLRIATALYGFGLISAFIWLLRRRETLSQTMISLAEVGLTFHFVALVETMNLSRHVIPASLHQSESLLAFLLMLEKLSPLERAVFVLREVFDYDYSDIAPMVGKSEANCRQMFHRARQRLSESETRFESTPEQQQYVTDQFVQMLNSGDIEGFVNLLAEDAKRLPALSPWHPAANPPMRCRVPLRPWSCRDRRTLR